MEHHALSRRELGVLTALLIPLICLAGAVATIPLDVYHVLDPLMFAKRSLSIAHDWIGVTAIKDPPLRYAPLVLIYTLVDPTWPVATAIAASYGALSVLVVAPLSFWAAARRLTSPRGAMLVLGALYVNLIVMPTMLWARPTTGWQYYVVIPWICGALVATDWTLDATETQTRRNRAILTGCLLGVAGLTQMLLALVGIGVVLVAYLLRRRLRELVIAGLSGLVFASYYLISTAAREQLLGGAARRLAPEPFMPVTLKELAFIALVGGCLALWYSQRERLSPVVGGIVLVVGPLWTGAALFASAYLSRFLPILTFPLLSLGLVAGVETLLRQRGRTPALRRVHADGGQSVTLPIVDRLSQPQFVAMLVCVSVGLTIVLFETAVSTFPFWRMGG